MADTPQAGATSSIEDQIRLREQKAALLRERGVHPYGNGVGVPHTTEFVRVRHCDDDAAHLEEDQSEPYGIAGRVVALRTMGKATFLSLGDRTGDLQIFVKKDKVGDQAYEVLKLTDLGDIAFARGRAMRTKTGELSIEATEFRLLTKALRPLPEKWHGLTDHETRYRQRYVDLSANLQVREIFLRRTRLIAGIRRFLDDFDFVEVETPVLHKPEEAGGATARPFGTHHNALDLDLKLRIALELHLKRLIVGGLERVYEIGRVFRNEGIDRRHNPEFTMLEFYQAYATYEDLMTLTETMVSRLATEVTGADEVTFQGVKIKFAPPWPRISMLGEVAKLHGAGGTQSQQLDALARLSAGQWLAPVEDRQMREKFARLVSTGEKIAWAFEALVEPMLPKDRPSFVVDFPLEVSPLARKRDSETRLVDRFEAFAGGMEIANAFSELNDPRDQEARFRDQVEAAARGDQETMPWDRDYTTLSRDAVNGISFGMEGVWFLLAGFALSFLGRGYRPLENLIASAVFGAVTFFVLRALKPPSFSYDRFFASAGELVVWSLAAAAASWLLAMWGASFGMLIGANGHVDPRVRYEWGIARTHLRLNRHSALLLAMLGVLPPGLFYALGIAASFRDPHQRPLVHPLHILFMVAVVLASLAVIGKWIQHRAQIARLQPGQRRKRPATVVMTGISVAGVAVGVWALTVVLSVMSGFESDLKRKILGTNSHALLLKYSADFSEWRSVIPKVAAVPGVAGVSPFILNEVILSHGQTVTGAELKGIDPATAGTVSELPRQVIAGELEWLSKPQDIPGTDRVVEPRGEAAKQLGGPEYEQYLEDTLKRRQSHPEEGGKVDPDALRNLPGICIGKEMSHQLRAWVGDVVNVLTPLGEMTPTGPVPRSRPFRVACILYSGMYEYDSKFVYIGIPEAQKFFRMGDNIVGLELKFTDVDAARALGRRVVAALGGFPYRTKDWAELNRNLFSALKLEKLAMAIILTFIVLVACFNILSTLIMLVLEKTKEISILKSMGARDSSVMKIFVLEGLAIGAIGTAIGLLLGLASCSFIERFGLQLDPDVYYISNLPVNVDGAQFVMVAAIAVALSYLATLYPATKASRLSPVDGLREE